MTQALSDAARRGIVQHFSSRAAGELTTSIAFEHLADDLNRQVGCADLAKQARRFQQDELRHSKICEEIAARYSSEVLPPTRPRGTRPYVLPSASDEDQRILRTVFGCCFGETIAVQWLTDAHRACTDPEARAENRQHLADEVHHSRLGWAYLGLGVLSKRDKQMIASYLPLMCERSLKSWAHNDTPTPTGIEAFGCPDEEATARSVERAINEVILPGFQLVL